MCDQMKYRCLPARKKNCGRWGIVLNVVEASCMQIASQVVLISCSSVSKTKPENHRQ